MDPIQALILGIVQGLTEFLPISSTAHLIIVPWLFQWDNSEALTSLTFDIALHAGTLVAVVAFFWRDWVRLLGGFVRTVTGRRLVDDFDARVFWLIVIASVPGAAAGALGEKVAEETLRAPVLVALFSIGLGVVLVAAEVIGSRERLLKHIGLGDATVIGLSQALAICPGVSRSGVTITAGLFRGLTRETAARFSFLMSTPIIFGAVLFNMRHLVKGGVPANEQVAFAIGVLAAAIVGFLAIKILLAYIQRKSLLVFAYYRFAFGLLIFTLVFTGSR